MGQLSGRRPGHERSTVRDIVLVVAASEAAVGLALVIAMFRNRESLNVDRSNLLKW